MREMGFWRQRRSLRGAIKMLIVSAPLAGCMMPTYQQPQGFSSTYYRYLQQGSVGGAFFPGPMGMPNPGEAVMPPVMTQPMPPVMEPPLGVPPAPAEKASSGTTGAWWSWLRKPVSFRSSRQVEEISSESEEE
jgi:hypothetical protein